MFDNTTGRSYNSGMNSICYINGKATTDAVVRVFPSKPAVAFPVAAVIETEDKKPSETKVTATILSEKVISVDELPELAQPVINVSGTASTTEAEKEPAAETNETSDNNAALSVQEEAPKKKKATTRKKKVDLE